MSYDIYLKERVSDEVIQLPVRHDELKKKVGVS